MKAEDITYCHRLYNIYYGMLQRCSNLKNTAYPYYGGRGITVCDQWKENRLAFFTWALSNGYQDDLTIERKAIELGYSPDNCTWVSKRLQARNKRNNVYATYQGQTKTLIEWCEQLNLDYAIMQIRVSKLGWSLEEAINPEDTLFLKRQKETFQTKEQLEDPYKKELIQAYGKLIDSMVVFHEYPISPETRQEKINRLAKQLNEMAAFYEPAA